MEGQVDIMLTTSSEVARTNNVQKLHTAGTTRHVSFCGVDAIVDDLKGQM